MTEVRGLEFTCSRPDSVERFNQALTHYLASSATTMAELDELLSKDPDMPMAVMFRACLLKLAADPRLNATITQIVEKLKERKDLNEREVLHREALSLWAGNQMNKAAEVYDTLIRLYPKDMLALRIAHYLHFYGQGGSAMAQSLTAAVRSWQPEEAFFGYLKGMECFALEEMGHYDEAEIAGRAALNINPADIWAAHAVTHIMQMQGRFEEGITLIDSLRANWLHVNNFVNHLYWHEALLFIGLKQPDQALRIYDQLLVRPIQDDFYLDVCNAASLLWRLVMLGVPVGERWEQLHEISNSRVVDDELVFATLHYLMAPAALGDQEAMQRGLDSIQAWSNRHDTQASVCRNVGLGLAEIICHLNQEEPKAAAKNLLDIQPRIHQIGGSHAQRHLFDQMIEFYA